MRDSAPLRLTGLIVTAIININALRPIPENLPAAVPTNYDTETAEQRIARREERWTPIVGHIY